MALLHAAVRASGARAAFAMPRVAAFTPLAAGVRSFGHTGFVPPPDSKGGKLRTYTGEDISKVDLNVHRQPDGFADRLALGVVKAMRLVPDIAFRKKYVHRAVMLETVAALPGMVGGVVAHLKSLRKMQPDNETHLGRTISELLGEAENERMHLMTFIEVTKPNLFERSLVLSAQLGIGFAYALFYACSHRAAHRFVGYLEEEAIKSYTGFLEEIDSGRIPNGPAPKCAIDYWKLPENATLRDVVVVIRADEAWHRDVNHNLSDAITQRVKNPTPDATSRNAAAPAKH